MKTSDLVSYLDNLLSVGSIPDDSLNGLQVANRADARCVALAVDASMASIREARNRGAQVLVVHHGLFWGKPVPLTGGTYERLRLLVEGDLALYAVHLPLDLHADLGNNVLLARLLGVGRIEDFGEYHGVRIGKKITFARPFKRDAMVARMQTRLHAEPVCWPFGRDTVRQAAVVSGQALPLLDQAVREGIDTYVTGEPGHVQYWTAREAGVNVIFGGHYATETLGVQAVGRQIKKDLKLRTVFLDIPTGY